MNKLYVLFVLVICAVFLIGCTQVPAPVNTNTAPANTNTNDTVANNPAPIATPPVQETTPPQELTPAPSTQFTGHVLAGNTTKYIEYNKQDFDLALTKMKVILLVFYKSTSPNSRTEEVSVFDAIDSMSYDNMVGFRVHLKDGMDGADEQALAAKYNVKLANTKVILADGKFYELDADAWNTVTYESQVGQAFGGPAAK
jgi:hypothetical protein